MAAPFARVRRYNRGKGDGGQASERAYPTYPAHRSFRSGGTESASAALLCGSGISTFFAVGQASERGSKSGDRWAGKRRWCLLRPGGEEREEREVWVRVPGHYSSGEAVPIFLS